MGLANSYQDIQLTTISLIVGLGLAGLAGQPHHMAYLREPASSTSLSHKRTSNDTIQPTEQAACLLAMIQCFSLTTKQHQPAYKPQKRSSEQGASCYLKHQSLEDLERLLSQDQLKITLRMTIALCIITSYNKDACQRRPIFQK